MPSKKALRNHCILSDQSYFIPIHIIGEISRIIQFLRTYLSEGACSFLDDDAFISGRYEATSLLYANNSFPFCLYGPAMMSFDAFGSDESNKSKLCLWLHPCYADELLREFEETTDHYCCTYEKIDCLARFEIRGAASLNILQRVFKPCDDMCKHAASYYRELGNLSVFPEKVWSRGHILDLCVEDVRRLKFREGGMTQLMPLDDTAEDVIRPYARKRHLQFPSPTKADSRRWSEKLFGDKKISNSKIHEIKHMISSISASFVESSRDDVLGQANRGENLGISQKQQISSAKNVLSELYSTFSLRVIRKISRNFSSEFVNGCSYVDKTLNGFDIIFSKNWALEVWRALNFAGGRTVGLQEVEQFSLECGLPSFPKDFLDSSSGLQYWCEKESVRFRVNSKLSKSKRQTNMMRKCDLMKKIFHPLVPSSKEDDEIVKCDDEMVVVREEIFLESFLPPLNKLQQQRLHDFGFLFGKLMPERKEKSVWTREMS